MENRTERFSEEKIYCHTYDGLVREMASAMEVESKKLFPEKEGEFDYEDIESWIGAVKFKEGKVPDIQASLSSDRGLKVVKFDVADQKGIESLDEKATNEELIYTMALTEAKMKVISDIAEEVYPAVAFQIGDYRKEMEKVRDEILGNKKENTSLDEVISRVMSKKTLATTMIVGGLILSACGVTIEIVTPNATATESQPRVTETTAPIVTEVIPGVTETATAEPTAEPTETEAPSEVKHPEFSREYQPAYIEHHEVVVEGITMNIDWGLSHWVTARPERPVSEIHIAPDIAPMVGEYFLKSCWYRFTHFMPGNESVSYEQYVELVKQGKGDISFVAYDEVNGGRWPVETSFDPAEGFALSFVDESLPIKIHDKFSTYYGSDGTGRLFIANKLDKAMVSRYADETYDNKWNSIFLDLLAEAFFGILAVENKCFQSANVLSACGIPGGNAETRELEKPIVNEAILSYNGGRDPVFWVVEK